MRYTAKDDISELGPCAVFVDGKPVERCVAFDLDAGYADQVAADRYGRPIVIYHLSELGELRLFGEVTVVPCEYGCFT